MGQNTIKGATKVVKFCHKKLKICLIFSIWNYGNHGTLSFFNTHECQETQMKNPFYLILSVDLVKVFWKWNFLSFQKDIFTKDFQRIHMIKISWWQKNEMIITY